MPDLGRAFLAAAARTPAACAIVDGDRRLTYAAWLERIHTAVAGLDALGLRRGDHLVTALRNRLEAATLHWAQFAGVVITPVNWRATRDELAYVLDDAQARAFVYEPVSAEAAAGAWQACLASGRWRARRGGRLGGRVRVHRPGPAGGTPGRARGRFPHALHLRHHRARQGGAAPPPGGGCGGALVHRPPPVPVRRVHPRGHAPLPHDGRAGASCVGVCRAAASSASRASIRRRPSTSSRRSGLAPSFWSRPCTTIS